MVMGAYLVMNLDFTMVWHLSQYLRKVWLKTFSATKESHGHFDAKAFANAKGQSPFVDTRKLARLSSGTYGVLAHNP
jgi:hypothetical protein